MSWRWRLGARFATALVITAVPVVTAGFGPALTTAAHETRTGGGLPSDAPSAQVDVASLTLSVTAMQAAYVRRLPPDERPQRVEHQTTIQGGLSLATRADRHRRIAVS